MSNTSILRYRDRVEHRLRDGDFEAEGLVQWFLRLEQWSFKEQDTADDDWPETAAAVANVKHRIMRALSKCAEPKSVRLSRIATYQGAKLDEAYVKSLRGGPYDEPIVVLGEPDDEWVELADGRHRVAAARRDGVDLLPGVYVPRQPGE